MQVDAGLRPHLERKAAVVGASVAELVAKAMGYQIAMPELVGVPVRHLLDEGAWSAQPVAIALAWLAVMFAGLALVSAAWAMWRGVPEPDLPDDEPPRR